MTSHKCSKCGLVSFTTAANCKRCQASLAGSSEATKSTVSFEAYEIDDAKPRSSFSPLRVLLLILLVAGPLWYYCKSSETAVAEQETAEKAAQAQKERVLQFRR